ncbi:ABC transporter substrate-binding protein [Natronoarchaeum rubrum]|uniref:ABC transporter substrate-binding protein n=1 Tax=Natronoarchaeum rubrum TaxID=755311 RepID=UPI0021137F26|nr:ABC transporter substrate-binding protein [Natronoarchaeum rubrum]
MTNQGRLTKGISRRNVLKTSAAAGAFGLAGCVDGGGGGGGGSADFGTLGANASTFDPAASADASSSSCIDLMYEPLVGFDFDLNPQPVLARDWERVDDTTFRFMLREGVQFHNGDEMTAEDVQHSIERYQGTVNTAVVASWYDSSEILGDYEIQLNLSRPYAPFLADLSGVLIVPAGTTSPADGETPLDDESQGTGPFQFESWSQDDRFVATKFDNYWWGDVNDAGDFSGEAPLDEVNLRVVVDPSAQFNAIQGGDVNAINQVPPMDVPTVEDDGNLTLNRNDGITFDFLIYPVNSGPFQNEKMRRGITRMIPRDDIVGDAVFNGTAVKGSSPYPPILGDPYWDEDFEQRLLDEYVGEDVDAATTLLDEAFSEEGIEAPYQTEIRTNENPVRQRWCEVIANTLSETEYFEVSVNVMEWSSYVEFITGPAAETSDMVALGWTASADPDSFVYQLFATDQFTPNGYNINHYSNEELDSLMQEGQTTFGADQRGPIYKDIAEILAQDVPVTFLWHGKRLMATRDVISDFQVHPSASADYSGIYSPALGQEIEYDG